MGGLRVAGKEEDTVWRRLGMPMGGLRSMWGGAVNRQPGYRARNLQRRGFSRIEIIPERTANLREYSLLNLKEIEIFDFSKIDSTVFF